MMPRRSASSLASSSERGCCVVRHGNGAFFELLIIVRCLVSSASASVSVCALFLAFVTKVLHTSGSLV